MNKGYIYKRRLLKLADKLDLIPKKEFDFNVWADENWEDRSGSCGTAACALGWATTIPSFRKLGLRMKKNFGTYLPSMKDDEYYDFAPERVGSKIFGLSESEFRYVFVPFSSYSGANEDRFLPEYNLLTPGPGYSATPKQVAKHIRKFVKAKYG